MPRCPKLAVPIRLPWASSGSDHHVNSAANTAVTTIAAAASTTSFVASHRPRVTPCVHASRWVPSSSSRASSGAPQNAPIAAGTPISTVPSSCSDE